MTCLAVVFAPLCIADNYDDEWEKVAQGKNSSGNERNVASKDVSEKQLQREQLEDADDIEEESPKGVRRFHEVLDDLLAEFGYDVRMGQLNNLKNLSIRRVEVSDALPNTYRSYVEMLVSERIRENSRVRLITCVTCKTKTSHLVEGRLMITSPTTNMDRMREAAQQMGIDQFMDVVLVYHTTHMVLGFEVFNTATNELVWTRTYNSETIKSRFQKLAVDYQQVEKARPGEEYTPEYRFLLGLGGGVIPNITGKSDDNGVMALMLRGAEKFDNRKHEFGLHSSIYLRKSGLINRASDDSEESEPAEGEKKKASDLTPWSFALGMYGMYSRHFVGAVESYNEIRHAANIGLGFIGTSGFLTTSARAGWDMYFGRRFATNLSLVYLMPSVATQDNENTKTAGGAGGDFTISVNL